MGRQIQIFTTERDNDLFRDYLKSTYDCLFFQNFSSLKENLYVDSFNDTDRADSGIYIQFTSFGWEPVYAQTTTKEKWYYVVNKSTAPIIEFSKTNWERKLNGRLYWGKYFSGTPDYDVVRFEAIYNDVIKWVKKNAGGNVKASGSNLYFFPDAWRKHKDE